jgi:hypothetical protein
VPEVSERNWDWFGWFARSLAISVVALDGLAQDGVRALRRITSLRKNLAMIDFTSGYTHQEPSAVCCLPPWSRELSSSMPGQPFDQLHSCIIPKESYVWKAPSRDNPACCSGRS